MLPLRTVRTHCPSLSFKRNRPFVPRGDGGAPKHGAAARAVQLEPTEKATVGRVGGQEDQVRGADEGSTEGSMERKTTDETTRSAEGGLDVPVLSSQDVLEATSSLVDKEVDRTGRGLGPASRTRSQRRRDHGRLEGQTSEHGASISNITTAAFLPRVLARLPGFLAPVVALLDTGAAVTLMSDRLALGACVEIKTSRNSGLRLANGAPLDVVGCAVDVAVNFGECGRGVPIRLKEVWVCRSLTEQLIVGVSDLRGSQIDLLRGEWRVENQSVVLNSETEVPFGVGSKLIQLPEELENIVGRAAINREQLKQLITIRRGAFSLNGELGLMKDAMMKIDLVDRHPVRDHDRPLPEYLREPVRRQLRMMQAEGVIEPSQSQYLSQMVVIPKKRDESGELEVRITCDYRRLNKKIVGDEFPIPSVAEILDRLGGNVVFSKLDLRSGYFQMELEEASRPITAFRGDGRLWQFRRVAMGLKTAPVKFQRAMAKIFEDLPFVYVYLDDTFVVSRDEQTHLNHLDTVLRRVEESGIKLRMDKCELAVKSVEFLGYKVSGSGVAPTAEKKATLFEFPTPKNRREVRSFLGAANYNRVFVPEFSWKAKPLNELLKKGAKFKWTPEHERAFNDLKNCIKCAKTLPFPDFSKEFVLTTDACEYGVGAVLSQDLDDGLGERAISYASKSLDAAELNYSATEKECLAVVFGMEKYRHHLLGRKFRLRTDHRPLTFLQDKSKLSGRLQRWWLMLQDFDFVAEYVPGPQNVIADALSRGVQPERQQVAVVRLGDEPTVDDWKKRQETDEEIVLALLECEANGKVLTGPYKNTNVEVVDGLLRRRGKIVVPRTERRDCLKVAHGQGHFGRGRTRAKIEELWWPGIDTDVEEFVGRCETCQRMKMGVRRQNPAAQTIEATSPFEVVGIDFTGPLPETRAGNQYLLLMVDHFSKWIEAYPTSDQRAETVAQCVWTYCCRHGVPQSLLSDQGAQFESVLVGELLGKLGVRKLRTSGYNPQCNGQTERMNRTVKQLIRCYVDESDGQREWDEVLPEILFAYHACRHETTQCTPFELVRGYAARDPVSILFSGSWEERRGQRAEGHSQFLEQLAERHAVFRERAVDEMRREFDARRDRSDGRAVDKGCGVGETVMLRNERARGFERRFVGPFVVVERLGSAAKIVSDGEEPRWVNIRRLKPCVAPGAVDVAGALDQTVAYGNRDVWADEGSVDVPEQSEGFDDTIAFGVNALYSECKPERITVKALVHRSFEDNDDRCLESPNTFQFQMDLLLEATAELARVGMEVQELGRSEQLAAVAGWAAALADRARAELRNEHRQDAALALRPPQAQSADEEELEISVTQQEREELLGESAASERVVVGDAAERPGVIQNVSTGSIQRSVRILTRPKSYGEVASSPAVPEPELDGKARQVMEGVLHATPDRLRLWIGDSQVRRMGDALIGGVRGTVAVGGVELADVVHALEYLKRQGTKVANVCALGVALGANERREAAYAKPMWERLAVAAGKVFGEKVELSVLFQVRPDRWAQLECVKTACVGLGMRFCWWKANRMDRASDGIHLKNAGVYRAVLWPLFKKLKWQMAIAMQGRLEA